MGLVTDQEIEDFWRDGVVVIRGVLPPDTLAAMNDPVGRVLGHETMSNMTELGAQVVPSSGGTVLNDPAAAKAGAPRGQFRSGTDHWWDDPDFEHFATRSPLPQVAAELMRSQELWFYEDSVLVKEPYTEEPTAIHQDMAYFQLEGDKVCTTWCPLDPISQATGATVYVKGSHRCHAMTLHGAHANVTDQWRRAISVRYCGDGTVYRFKRGTPLKPHHAEVTEGTPVTHPRCPQVWPR